MSFDCSKNDCPKTGKVFIWRSCPASQSIGRGRIVGREPLMFARVENSVTKSCQFFRRKNRKDAILGWKFPLFLAGSLVVREGRHRRDRISDQNSQKRINKRFGSLRFFFQKWPAHPVFTFQWGIKNFHFFGRGKTNFFLGGGITSKLAIASDHSGAYTSMPHPFFGAKDVCYIEKTKKQKGGQIKISFFL